MAIYMGYGGLVDRHGLSLTDDPLQAIGVVLAQVDEA